MTDDKVSIGDVVRVDYDRDENDSVEPIYIGIVKSFDELGVEVGEVYRITSDEVLSGFKTEGWTVKKIGSDYNEDSKEVLTEDNEWIPVEEFE